MTLDLAREALQEGRYGKGGVICQKVGGSKESFDIVLLLRALVYVLCVPCLDPIHLSI